MDGNNMYNETVNEAVAEVENTTYEYNAVENSYDYAAYDEEVQSGGNGLAIASMSCGIAAASVYLLTYCCFFRILWLILVLLAGIAGLVMGIIAKKKKQKKGFWLTGIICSSIIIALVCFNLVMTVVVTFFSTSIYTLPILGELLLMLGL